MCLSQLEGLLSRHTFRVPILTKRLLSKRRQRRKKRKLIFVHLFLEKVHANQTIFADPDSRVEHHAISNGSDGLSVDLNAWIDSLKCSNELFSLTLSTNSSHIID